MQRNKNFCHNAAIHLPGNRTIALALKLIQYNKHKRIKMQTGLVHSRTITTYYAINQLQSSAIIGNSASPLARIPCTSHSPSTGTPISPNKHLSLEKAPCGAFPCKENLCCKMLVTALLFNIDNLILDDACRNLHVYYRAFFLSDDRLAYRALV